MNKLALQQFCVLRCASVREDAEATPSLADLPEAITLRFGADMFTVTIRRCSESRADPRRGPPEKIQTNKMPTLLRQRTGEERSLYLILIPHLQNADAHR